MKARLLVHERSLDAQGRLTEIVIWLLPKATEERPHRLKYRFFFGDREGRCLVRYDNERGKGDHRHYAGGVELPYEFKGVERLLQDFRADIDKARSANDDDG